MKKIVLNKKLKMLLTWISIILIGIISFFLYRYISSPKTKEESISLYQYVNNSDINYEVFLKPNILYERESLGKNEIYFTEFIDNIKATFNYKFSGEREANITGDYEIVAVVEGYTKGEEKSNTIWKKGFMISPKKSFNIKNKAMSISKDIAFGLEQYDDFAQEVIKQSNVRTETRLSIIMNINLKTETDEGTIEEKISPSIIIPLGASYFNISESEAGEKSGAIEGTKAVEIPIDMQKVIFYGVMIGILCIALLVLLVFTQSVVEEDILVKHLNKIFKNHGSRLVALSGKIEASYECFSKVRTIEDLVRIADEVEKPIMYKHSSVFREINEFYVFDDNWMYMFDLCKYIIELENEENDNESIKETISE